MSTGYCLMCNDKESRYSPGTGTDFICSKCVQILLAANQVDLKRAYNIAKDKGYTNKAKAIESFLYEETLDHERKAENLKRGLGRKKIGRMVGPSRDQIWA